MSVTSAPTLGTVQDFDRRITLLSRQAALNESARAVGTATLIPLGGLVVDGFARAGMVPGVESASQLFQLGTAELAVVTLGLTLVTACCAGGAAALKRTLRRS